MTTEKIGGIELYVENLDLENSGQQQKVYGTNCADDFWALMSNAKAAFAYVDYLWVPPDLKRNADKSTRTLLRGAAIPANQTKFLATAFPGVARPRRHLPLFIARAIRTLPITRRFAFLARMK